MELKIFRIKYMSVVALFVERGEILISYFQKEKLAIRGLCKIQQLSLSYQESIYRLYYYILLEAYTPNVKFQ